MDNRKMFQRRHYEVMAVGMAKMAQALENIEAQALMSLPVEERTRLKAEVYTAVLQAMTNMFERDNTAFNKKLFSRAFQTYLRNELRTIQLDKRSPTRYNIGEMLS
jgi:hypothetical protein